MNILDKRIKDVKEELEGWKWLYRSVDKGDKWLVIQYGQERSDFLKTLQKANKFWDKK